jgi:hypothetical protein
MIESQRNTELERGGVKKGGLGRREAEGGRKGKTEDNWGGREGERGGGEGGNGEGM